MGTTIGEKSTVQGLPPQPDPEIRTIGEAVAPLVEEAKGWVNKQYQEALAGAREAGQTLEEVGDKTAEFLKNRFTALGTYASSARQTMEDLITKLPPERRASVADASAALLGVENTAKAAIAAAHGHGNGAVTKALATAQAEMQKCQVAINESAKGGDKACAAAAIQVNNASYELASQTKKLKDIVDRWRA